MKSLYRIFGIIVFLLISVLPQFAQETPDAKFDDAAKLYSEGKFQDAVNKWMDLYNMGFRSAQLDYNIGNAYFKLNNVPGAILFYERAHLLKPADEDIYYNLQIARTMVVDKFTEIPEVFFVNWFNFLSLSLSTNIWAKLSLGAFILFLLFMSVYLYTRKHNLKVSGFWIAVFMLAFSISSFFFASRNETLVFNNPKGIIITPLINGKSSPDNSGTDLFVLHEGTKVAVVDEVGEWFEIRLSDGNKGWVPSNCLTKL